MVCGLNRNGRSKGGTCRRGRGLRTKANVNNIEENRVDRGLKRSG